MSAKSIKCLIYNLFPLSNMLSFDEFHGHGQIVCNSRSLIDKTKASLTQFSFKSVQLLELRQSAALTVIKFPFLRLNLIAELVTSYEIVFDAENVL